MKLGVSAQFVIGSTVFSETKKFMDQLGFVKVEEGKSPSKENFVPYTDGRANILLNESAEFDYSGIIYFTPNIEEVVERLEAVGIPLTIQEDKNQIRSAFFMTKDKIPVNIVQASHDLKPTPFGKSEVEWGHFGEYAIKVGDLDESIEYWEKLGFETLFRDEKWEFAILSDGLIVLGLHAHDMGVRSALTYFHPDMKSIVDQLKKRGLTFESETEYESNGEKAVDAAIRAPGGQVFFLFTGDVSQVNPS